MAAAEHNAPEPGAKLVYQRGQANRKRPRRATPKAAAMKAEPIAPAPAPQSAAAVAPVIDVAAPLRSSLVDNLNEIENEMCWLRIGREAIGDTAVHIMDHVSGDRGGRLVDRLLLLAHDMVPRIKAIEALIEKAGDTLADLNPAAGKPDPVVALYELAISAQDTFDRFHEREDPVRNGVLEEEMDNAAYRVVMAKPTTAAGIAAMLKWLAHELEHYTPENSESLSAALVRNLVRQLLSDNTWTCPAPASIRGE